MFEFLFSITIICFLFGIVYPVFAVLFYPVYKIFVEDISFFEYVRSL